MAKIIIGIFHDSLAVEKAVQDLGTAGFSRDNISLVAKNGDGTCTLTDTQDHNGDGNEHGMAAGVAIGAAASALGMGLMLIIIPPLGALAVGGPLLALVLATGVGAAAGGLVGTLADMGVARAEAEYYCAAVSGGGTLLAVKSPEDRCEIAEQILKTRGAQNVSEHDSHFAPEKLHEVHDEIVFVQEILPDEHGFEDRAEDFRAHYLNHFSESGFGFDSFRPAYEYGWLLGTDGSGITREWILLEPEARADWEQRNGPTWEVFKDAVRHAWDSTRQPAGT